MQIYEDRLITLRDHIKDLRLRVFENNSDRSLRLFFNKVLRHNLAKANNDEKQEIKDLVNYEYKFPPLSRKMIEENEPDLYKILKRLIVDRISRNEILPGVLFALLENHWKYGNNAVQMPPPRHGGDEDAANVAFGDFDIEPGHDPQNVTAQVARRSSSDDLGR